jgi:LysM repeat protein
MRKMLFASRFTIFTFVLGFLALFYFSITYPAQDLNYPLLEDFPLPKSVSLCGEKIPVEDLNVREMLDREFTIVVWDRAQVFLWLKRAGRYFPYIEKKLAEMGMPEDLKYLAVAESSLISTIRSEKGALGLWQLMSHTARRNGLRKDRMMDERRSFEHSTKAALKYLAQLKEVFGTWTLALAAYNCGEGRLSKEIEEQKVRNYYRLNLPLETERFVFRIAAIKVLMENPERYGYYLAKEHFYRPINCDTVQVEVKVPLSIADVAQAVGTDFKALKELNPQILGYHLPAGHYMIKVPTGLGSKMATVLNQLTTTNHTEKNIRHGYYVVQPGDTLGHIAQNTGLSVDRIRRLNGIQGSTILEGQKIKLTP